MFRPSPSVQSPTELVRDDNLVNNIKKSHLSALQHSYHFRSRSYPLGSPAQNASWTVEDMKEGYNSDESADKPPVDSSCYIDFINNYCFVCSLCNHLLIVSLSLVNLRSHIIQLSRRKKLHRWANRNYFHLHNSLLFVQRHIALLPHHENYPPFAPNMNPNLPDSHRTSSILDLRIVINHHQSLHQALPLERHLLNSCGRPNAHEITPATLLPRCASIITLLLSALIFLELRRQHLSARYSLPSAPTKSQLSAISYLIKYRFLSIELAHFYVSRISFWPSRQCNRLFSFCFREVILFLSFTMGAKIRFSYTELSVIVFFLFLIITIYVR